MSVTIKSRSRYLWALSALHACSFIPDDIVLLTYVFRAHDVPTVFMTVGATLAGRHVASNPVRCGTVSGSTCSASVGIPRTRGPQSTPAGVAVVVVLGSPIPSLFTFTPLSYCSPLHPTQRLCFLAFTLVFKAQLFAVARPRCAHLTYVRLGLPVRCVRCGCCWDS
jgi:hypothetical protein